MTTLSFLLPEEPHPYRRCHENLLSYWGEEINAVQFAKPVYFPCLAASQGMKPS